MLTHQDRTRSVLTITAHRSDGHFTAVNLSITLSIDGKQLVWHPGDADPENLQGTTRTLGRRARRQNPEPIEPGLVSRSGWALVDDSTRPLFDSTDFRFLNGEKSPWPWVMERPANEPPGKYRIGTSSAMATTTARRWAIS